MKTKFVFISITILSLLILSLFITYSCTELESTNSGSNCEANAIIIASSTVLQDIDLSASYCLTTDIDLTSLTFEPIGYPEADITTSNFTGTEFTGTLDGQGYKITGLTINKPSASFIGLFGKIGANGQVKNLVMENSNINGDLYCGILAGENQGNIDNVKVEGTGSVVTGELGVGGLIGYNSSGTISNSYVNADVTGRSSYVGGFIGRTLNSSITGCYANGNISGVSSGRVGGLIGEAKTSSITNSYSEGTVSGNDMVGGLLGYNGETTQNSYANCTVSGRNTVGGLVGYNFAAIQNSYAGGSVTGTGDNVGGLAGYNATTIQNSYANGSVTGTGDNVGGLAGYGFNGTVTNSYFDTSSTGQTIGVGGTGASQDGVTGITSSNIISGGDEPFAGATWNFTTIWKKQGIGEWPSLSWQP